MRQMTIEEYLTRSQRRLKPRDYQATFAMVCEVAREIMRLLRTDRFFPHQLVAFGLPYSESWLKERILPYMLETRQVKRVGERRGYQLL